MIVRELAGCWRARAADLRAWAAAEGAAVALEQAASELEATLQEEANALLTLEEAAREVGCAKRTLREKVASGVIRNSGRRGAPRVRRADLPTTRKPPATGGAYDPAADARRLLST
ncbi:MAG TPA: helix-turn-helix domain-containing protein [Longimicrobiales bacterium]|nr:helix-turn-helix domain-containing protein [Longimicrobiales bacterium]